MARLASNRLGFELVTDSDVGAGVAAELNALGVFSDPNLLPDKIWPHLVRSAIARRGVEHHLVIAAPGLFDDLPNHFRVLVLRDVNAWSWKNGGQTADLILSGGTWTLEQMADMVEHAAKLRGFAQTELLPPTALAEIQFQARLMLARYGIGFQEPAPARRKGFGHPSEEVFANLLNFYRIPWDYEPRSFPLQWDKDGRVLEAFTPDFYLPDFDLYIELTTMKQAHVTKKNRKVRRLRAIYPHVNIQVFYQKDVQDLVMKYGLSDRLAQ